MRLVGCSSAERNDVERLKGVLDMRLIVCTEKIPAWVGTNPHVTSSTANDPQNTGQWLLIVSPDNRTVDSTVVKNCNRLL